MVIDQQNRCFIGNDGLISGAATQSDAMIQYGYSPIPNNRVVLIGTDGEGLFFRVGQEDKTARYIQKTMKDGLGSNFISSIFVTPTGPLSAGFESIGQVIFVGTYSPDNHRLGGLSVSYDFGKLWETFRVDGIYDPLQRNRKPFKTGMSSNNIRDIKFDRLTSKLVIATDSGVLSCIFIPSQILPLSIEDAEAINDKFNFSVYSTLNGLGSLDVYSIEVEEQFSRTVRSDEPIVKTVWWAGTAEGLSRSIDQGYTWQTYNVSYKPENAVGPALTFISPNNTAIIKNIIKISVQASNNSGVQKVEISFDNQNFSEIQFDGTYYTTMFNTQSLEDGRAFIYARSIDIFGNTSFAVPIVVTVDNSSTSTAKGENTSIEIIDPVENATVSGIYPLQIKITSDINISSVQLTDHPGSFPYSAQLVIPPRLKENSLFESVYQFMYDTTTAETGAKITIIVQITDENSDTNETQRSFYVFNKLPIITSIAVSGHTIWAGTVLQCGLGMSSDNGKTWKYFTTNNGLISNNIQTISVRKNEVWVGTDKGLCMTFDIGRTWQNFNSLVNKMPGDDVRSIAFQGSTVWVGTVNGLGKLEKQGMPFKSYRTLEGIAGNQINNIFVDCDQKTIWASTNCGISKTVNGGRTWTSYRIENGLPSNYVNAITRYQNKIYAGTFMGLGVSQNEGRNFKQIGSPPLGANNVSCFRVDASDLWIGTENGLTKLDQNGNWVTYRKEGIFSSILQQLSDKNIGIKNNKINFITF